MTYLYYFTCDRKKRNLILIFQYVCVMLQLLKITFIAFSLLFVANISHANTCANDLSECTPKDLCEIATVNSNDVFSWSNLRKAKKHVALAKNLGMDCGVTVVTDLCDNDPNKCKINQLCEKATKVVNGNKAWNTSAQVYIDVAKKYNLSCDVETKITEKSCAQEPKNCNDTQLCDMGVIHGAETKTWDTTSKWIKHANEAKMRGLSCGVGVKTKTIVKIDTVDKKSCLKEPKLCNATDLCLIASTSTSTWSQNRFLRHYVIEAKKRGLSCGVDMKTEAIKVETKKIIQKNCSQDAAKCDNEKLCYFSIKFGSNPKEWTLNRYYTKHIAEAKKRGLSCGVGMKAKVKKIETKKKCSIDAKSCTNIALCQMATKKINGKKSWDKRPIWAFYITEAKKRGLSCGIGMNASIIDKNKTKTSVQGCNINVKVCNQKELCHMATTGSKPNAWDKIVKSKRYVDEAKRRGYTCNVGTQDAKTCVKDYKICNDNFLCFVATKSKNGSKIWDYSRRGHVSEAKRRELSCSVAQDLFDKNDFAKLNTTQRKQLQYGLKQLGFYRRNIDGLYGAGTEKAVRLYTRSKGIKSGYPYSVYNKIITEVIVPSSFTVVSKPQTNKVNKPQTYEVNKPRNNKVNKPRNNNTKGLKAITSNPLKSADETYELCRIQANAAYAQAYYNTPLDNYSSYNLSCNEGLLYDFRCTLSPNTGGFAGGFNRVMNRALKANGARAAVRNSCLAHYGWKD